MDDTMTGEQHERAVLTLSHDAAAFLLGTVKHINQAKILPSDEAQALQTSAWLEEIEAATSAALRTCEGRHG